MKDDPPLARKYIHVKVGLLRTARPTPNLCNVIRDAVEKCDDRIGGVEVTIKRLYTFKGTDT